MNYDEMLTMARERWIEAALLAAAAMVFALYVTVLERDVGRAQIAHAQDRAEAVAAAQAQPTGNAR
jgi:hypothetical protein